MFGNFTTCRSLLAAAMIMVAGAPAGMAYAQQALAVVNGEPITELEIQQRSKLDTKDPRARGSDRRASQGEAQGP
jgi:hypothetical protein